MGSARSTVLRPGGGQVGTHFVASDAKAAAGRRTTQGGASGASVDAEQSNTVMMTRVTTILSIQSSVAYGHVGNSAVTFPLMRMGVEVWPVITVHFSNHTGYESWRGPLLSCRRPSRCRARDRRARSARSGAMRCCRAIKAPRRSAR